MNALAILVALTTFFAGMIVGLLLSAPDGYEGPERGFRFGISPQDQAALDEFHRAAEARAKFESECG